MRFLAADMETGGLNPKEHQPTEISVVLFDGGEPVTAYTSLFKENKKLDITLAALRIQGRSVKELNEHGKDELAVYQELRDWLATVDDNDDLTVVSHNAIFDQQFWDAICFRLGVWEGQYPNKKFRPAHPLFRGPWACTKRLATALDLPDYKLDTVAAHFGLKRSGETHGAEEDAVLCGRIYHALTTGQAGVRG